MTMHGDLLSGVSFALFIPVYISKAVADPTPGAYWVNFFICVTCLFNWIAYLRNHHGFSMLASVFSTGSMSAMGIYQWPYPGQSTLLPQFLGTLCQISGNMDLSFTRKMITTFHTTGMALIVANYMPNSVLDNREALPMIVAATAVHVGIHYHANFQPKGSKSELLSAQMASLILAVAFAYQLALEIGKMAQIPGYAAREGGYNIVKMAFLSFIGIAAAGAFKDQVDVKTQLEGLVKERTKEIELQSQKLKMVSLAMEASETKIAILNKKPGVIWSNPAFQELLDNKETACIFHSLKLSQTETDKIQDFFSHSCQKTFELELQNEDLAVSITCFEEDKYLLALSDVSQRRARERAEKSVERVEMQKLAMNDAMETLSHELRTPLQGIIGMTSLLLDSSECNDLRESLTTVVGSSRWLLTLINNLLDVRKVDAKMMSEFQLSAIPLNESVNETAQFCRPVAAINDISVETKIQNDPTWIMSNPLRFQQVLVNLVSNAIKHTKAGTSVMIETEVLSVEAVQSRLDDAFAVGLPNRRPEDGGATKLAVISVRDSGRGVPLAMQGSVFGKFSQYSEDNKTQSEIAQPAGTGLGLNLCLKFMERMAGNIWVVNESYGASFSFYLPVVESPKPTSSSATEALIERSGQAYQTSGLSSMESYRVLVVDDVLVNIKVLTRMLKRIPGVGVIATADSGKKGLEAIHKDHFDLVITDIRMPEMTGFEFCDAIRKSKIKKKPIVVGLTADTSESLHKKCAATGLWYILHKPVSNAQIQAFFESTLCTLKPCDAGQSIDTFLPHPEKQDSELPTLEKENHTSKIPTKKETSPTKPLFNTELSDCSKIGSNLIALC